jgi:hypothetical protein
MIPHSGSKPVICHRWFAVVERVKAFYPLEQIENLFEHKLDANGQAN